MTILYENLAVEHCDIAADIQQNGTDWKTARPIFERKFKAGVPVKVSSSEDNFYPRILKEVKIDFTDIKAHTDFLTDESNLIIKRWKPRVQGQNIFYKYSNTGEIRAALDEIKNIYEREVELQTAQRIEAEEKSRVAEEKEAREHWLNLKAQQERFAELEKRFGSAV